MEIDLCIALYVSRSGSRSVTVKSCAQAGDIRWERKAKALRSQQTHLLLLLHLHSPEANPLIMVAVSLLFSIAPAFILSAHAFPALRRWPDGPTHINGEDAEAAYNSTHGGSFHIRQQDLCQSITMDQLNAMGDALQDVKVCVSEH
jgi:hypothetical protein